MNDSESLILAFGLIILLCCLLSYVAVRLGRIEDRLDELEKKS